MLSKSTLLSTIAVSAALITATPAQATPAMCGAHAEHSDSPNGYASSTPPGAAVGADPTYITACAGDTGANGFDTAAGSDVNVPSVSTDAS